MSSRFASFLLLASGALASQQHSNSLFTHSVTHLDGVWSVHAHLHPSALAFGSVSQDVEHASNFGVLNVATANATDDSTDLDLAFAAGFLEASLTSERITSSVKNLYCQVSCDGSVPASVQHYLDTQLAWTEANILSHADDPYWQFVSLTLSQWKGAVAGYNATVASEDVVDVVWALRLANFVGDLFDIIPATDVGKRRDFDAMTNDELVKFQVSTGHCSAIIKLADDLSDIFWGHSSWFVYSDMIRYYKTYDFSSLKLPMASKKMSFSSYPGMLSSLDDFYLMHDSGLAMVQTTNNIFDNDLYDLVVPESLPAWMRVRAANSLSKSGSDWYSNVARYNSGTYNNQYMVVDTNKFTPGNAVQPGTLWVVEQIPGLVVGADATNVLQFSYFASFNVPYFPEIYVKSGYPAVDAKNGRSEFSEYQLAPRAQIFRRDHTTVTDITGLQEILRSNTFGTGDPLAPDPFSAVCSRGDLATPPFAGGCYDSKGTSATLFREGQAWIVNGPTAQGQPPFVWAGELAENNEHIDQPDVWDFEWELMTM